MDPRILSHYSNEMIFLRELLADFAQRHPKVARRLGLHAGETGDAFVERLIQTFSLLFARMQTRFDDAFPLFIQPLLQSVYPNYVNPTPSMTVARLYPGGREGDLMAGHPVKRGASFVARAPDGEQTLCKFTSSQDVMLYPLTIISASVSGIPPDIPLLDRQLPPGTQISGSLRLRLRTTNNAPVNGLTRLNRLPVYLSGDEKQASQLFELIHTSSVATVIHVRIAD